MAHPRTSNTQTTIRRQVRQRLRRTVAAWRAVAVKGQCFALGPVLVFAAQPTFTPGGEGMPGNSFVTKLLSWLGYLALAGCLGSIMAGGGVWAWGHHAGNGRGASWGKNFVIGGAIGAAFVGMAPTVVSLFQTAGAS